MNKAKVIDQKAENAVMKERLYLSNMRSPFIVNMICSFQDLNNLYLGSNEDIIDMNYLVNLNKSNTNSNMVVEGILKDNSKKSFKGTLDFKEGSSNSIGHENENCI